MSERLYRTPHFANQTEWHDSRGLCRECGVLASLVAIVGLFGDVLDTYI